MKCMNYIGLAALLSFFSGGAFAMAVTVDWTIVPTVPTGAGTDYVWRSSEVSSGRNATQLHIVHCGLDLTRDLKSKCPLITRDLNDRIVSHPNTSVDFKYRNHKDIYIFLDGKIQNKKDTLLCQQVTASGWLTDLASSVSVSCKTGARGLVCSGGGRNLNANYNLQRVDC